MIHLSQLKLSFLDLINICLILLTSCPQICTGDSSLVPCLYYPDFPEKSNYYVVNCTSTCCPPQNKKIPEAEVCCLNNSKSWIAYPVVVSASVIILAFLLYIIYFKKLKIRLLKRRISDNNNQVQMTNPDIYQQTNLNDINAPRNGIINWEESPPSYNEIISNVKADTNFDSKNSNSPLPVIPNALSLSSNRTNHENNRLSIIE